MWVAIRIKQTLLCGYQCAGAVNIYRATLKHHVDHPRLMASMFCPTRSNRCIFVVRHKFLAPSVELPTSRDEFTALNDVTWA